MATDAKRIYQCSQGLLGREVEVINDTFAAACQLRSTKMATESLELVVWTDSHGCSSEWRDFSEAAEQEVIECQSVGWVIRDDDKALTIVPHMSATSHCCGDMTIPKVAITKRTILKYTKGCDDGDGE